MADRVPSDAFSAGNAHATVTWRWMARSQLETPPACRRVADSNAPLFGAMSSGSTAKAGTGPPPVTLHTDDAVVEGSSAGDAVGLNRLVSDASLVSAASSASSPARETGQKRARASRLSPTPEPEGGARCTRIGEA